MKKQTLQGNWKNLLARLFVGAFLPALATYFVLDFLLSLQMTSSGASWLAFFIAAAVWNFCNYLMGHIDTDKTTSGNADESWWLNHKYDEYYESIYHAYMVRNHHIKLFNRNDF